MAFNNWKEAAENNKLERISWKKYLGISLNKFVAEKAAEKKAQSSIKTSVRLTAINNNILNILSEERLDELINIGVSARMAEMLSEKTILKAKLSENLSWRAKVRRMANGTGFVFIPPTIDLKDGEMVEVKAIRMDVEKRN